MPMLVETKQGLEIALNIINRKAMNKQLVTITMPNSDGDNANGIATWSSDAIADPHPDNWYDLILDKWLSGASSPLFMQHMGNDPDNITGPNQYVYVPATQKIHVSSWVATDTYKYTGKTANGGKWSLIMYKRSTGASENKNVRPVHDWSGAVTHFKQGIKQATMDFSMLMADPFDAENMLLLGNDYGIVVEEKIVAADWSQHDGSPIGYDIIEGTLDLNVASDGWFLWDKQALLVGVTLVKVASIAAINAIGKYYVDPATDKIYLGYTADALPGTDSYVSYMTTATGKSQELLIREDYYAVDGATVEFVTLYPLAKIASISTSNPDQDDCTVQCSLMSAGEPCTV